MPVSQPPVFAPAAQQQQSSFYAYRDANEQYGSAGTPQPNGYQPFIDPALGGARQQPQTQQPRYFPQPIQPSVTPTIPQQNDAQAQTFERTSRKSQLTESNPLSTSQPVPTAAALAMAAADAVIPLEGGLDDKRFECVECGRRFRRREHLKRHISTLHQRDKPYACEYCNRRFSRGDNLLQHSRMRHRYGIDMRDKSRFVEE
ncbi:uncharacterized protein V2V93DRAFT_362677 [Kockiozyma suomiensis]|uniref:uncharacterized protein n=1 Tax=Kockiozyma suomiensis TaxID=1337062 RepID=UPI0033431E86